MIKLEEIYNDENIVILELAETRRTEERIIRTERNNVLLHTHNRNGQRGIGLLVHETWSSKIIEFTTISDRITVLKYEYIQT